MNTKEVIKGLEAVQEGISTILSAIQQADTSVPEVSAPVKSKGTVPSKTVTKSEEEPSSTKVEITKEKLSQMTYNNLKKFCKEIGVSAVGDRNEIEARLLGLSDSTSEEPEVEEEEIPEDDTHAKILSLTEDMSNEEIADLLAEVGISPKGKRESLIAKLENAVEEGLLSLDEEDTEEEEEEPVKEVSTKSKKSEGNKSSKKSIKESESEEEQEEEIEEDNGEDDDVNDFENNDNITEERAKACEEFANNAEKAFAKRKLTRKTMEKFIKDFYGEDDDLSEISDEDILATYIDLAIRFIDDEGDTIEEAGGAYMLNGEVACCGVHCQYSEDTEKYICEKCGEEYEIE